MSSFLDLSSGPDCIEEYERLQNANKQLKQTNIELFNELTALRAEHRNYKELCRSYEELQAKNSVNVADLENVQKENENLKTQVKESQQMIEDLREVQLPQKKILKPQRRSLEKEPNQNGSGETQNPMEPTSQENLALSIELKRAKSKLAKYEQLNMRLVDAFDMYFKADFENVENLFQFVQKQNKAGKGDSSGNNVSSVSTKTNQQLKDSLTKQKQLTNKITQEYSNYKQQMENEKLRLQAALQSIEMSANEIKQENQFQEKRMQQEIALKDQKIISLEGDNKRLKQQLNDINQSLSAFPSQNQYSSDSSSYDSGKDFAAQIEINNLKNEIAKINSLKSQCDSLIDQKNKEIFQLKMEKDDLEMKYTECFSQLEIQQSKNKELAAEINKITIEKDSLMEKNQKFDKVLRNQQIELEELSNCKNQLSALVYKMRSSFQIIENSTLQLKTNHDKVQEKYSKIKNAIKGNTQKEQPVVDSIPVTSWYCQDFDHELCSKISEYAQNDFYSTTVKLRHVFELIAKHYNTKIALIEQKSNEKCKENEVDHLALDQFLESIGKQLNIQHFTSSSIKNPEELSKFREILSTLINECLSLRQENENQTTILNKITEKIGLPSDRIIEQVDYYTEQIETLSNQLEKFKKRCCLLKKQQKQCNTNLETIKSQWIQSNRKSQKIISTLRSQLSTIPEENSQKKAVESNCIDSKTEQVINQINKKEEEISELRQKLSKLNNDLVSLNLELEEKEKENQENQNTIIKLNDDIQFWKQSLDTFKKIELQKEVEYQKMHNNYKETQEKLKENDQKEKETMIQQYDALITKQKNKNIQLKNTIDQLRETISRHEATIQKLGKEKIRLLHDYEQMSSQYNQRNENNNRQQEIDIQKLMAVQLANETKSQNLIEEMKNKNDSEKKEIFAYAIKLFRNYYDSSKQINQKVFQDTLNRASNELQKLLKQDESIRYMLGITKNDSIETNVSSIIMKTYNQ